ncbi:unnamed protein product, partial [Hapterophycus canaliculatus]
MTLVTPKWSSASSEMDRVPKGGYGAPADITRRQSLPSTKAPARRQEKLRDNSRWKMTEGMSVSGRKPVFSPKPPQQQPSRAEAEQHERVSSLQGSIAFRTKKGTAKDTSGEAGGMATTDETRPRGQVLPFTGQELNAEHISSVTRQLDSSSTTTNSKKGELIAAAATVARAAGADVGAAGSMGFHLPGRPSQHLLTRSGSAPSSSAMVLTSASAARMGLPACQPSEARTSADGERSKHLSESEAELGRTRQDCWDESGKTLVSTDAAKAPPDGARSTSG